MAGRRGPNLRARAGSATYAGRKARFSRAKLEMVWRDRFEIGFPGRTPANRDGSGACHSGLIPFSGHLRADSATGGLWNGIGGGAVLPCPRRRPQMVRLTEDALTRGEAPHATSRYVVS